MRREFLLKYGIRFNHLICVNDRSFFWESMLKAQCVVFTRDMLVHYRINLGSSLVSGRIRNFSCHFESYKIVNELCIGLPNDIWQCVLNAELLDMSHWVEQSLCTEYADGIQIMVKQFIETLDYSLWGGNFEGMRWYKRLSRLLSNRFLTEL